MVDAWDGLPGALTKWFLASVGNEGLLRMLAGRGPCGPGRVRRRARRGRRERARVQGRGAGTVAESRGARAGSAVIPSSFRRVFMTYAEMGEGKNTDSHRARAFRAVRGWLESVE